MDKDRTRGERRYRTWRYSRRVWNAHRRFFHGSEGLRCDCAATLLSYRKRTALGCRCKGKTKGAPKLPGSLHKSGWGPYRPTTTRRIWNRRLARAWRRRQGAEDADEIELPSGPIIGRRSRSRIW